VKAVPIRRAARNDGSRRASTSAERVLAELTQRLRTLVGPAGVEAMLARSLVLARRTRPALAKIAVAPDGRLAGFSESAVAASDLEACRTAIIAHLIDLFVTLVGKDLATRVISDVLPGAGDEEHEINAHELGAASLR
jgi:hypothetical protein